MLAGDPAGGNVVWLFGPPVQYPPPWCSLLWDVRKAAADRAEAPGSAVDAALSAAMGKLMRTRPADLDQLRQKLELLASVAGGASEADLRLLAGDVRSIRARRNRRASSGAE